MIGLNREMTGFFDRIAMRNEDPKILSTVWQIIHARMLPDLKNAGQPALMIPADNPDFPPADSGMEEPSHGLDFERGCLGSFSSPGELFSGQLDIARWKNDSHSGSGPKGFPLLPAPGQSSARASPGKQNAFLSLATPGEEYRSEGYSLRSIPPDSVFSESSEVIFWRSK